MQPIESLRCSTSCDAISQSSHVTDTLAQQLSDDLETSFPSLVDAYGSMVLTLATRLTDQATGEDIAQEVFLRAYRALRTYDEAQRANLDLRPWLATITRNLVRNEYRRRDRKPTESLGQRGEAIVAPADAAIDIIDEHDSVEGLLSQMPDDQRDAVVLRHVVGLPMREVALTLGCPVGTAKSHVSRGIDRLRQGLGDTPNDGASITQPTSEGEAR